MLEDKLHALGFGLLDLGGVGGHILSLSAVDDRGVGTETHRRAGDIHCDIAAADDDDLFAELELLPVVDGTQKVDASVNARKLLTRDA